MKNLFIEKKDLVSLSVSNTPHNYFINLCFLDAVYTERYMGKPEENPDNYKVSVDPNTVVKNTEKS